MKVFPAIAGTGSKLVLADVEFIGSRFKEPISWLGKKAISGLRGGALEPAFAGVKNLRLSSVFQNDTFSQLKRQKSRGKWVLLQGHSLVVC